MKKFLDNLKFYLSTFLYISPFIFIFSFLIFIPGNTIGKKINYFKRLPNSEIRELFKNADTKKLYQLGFSYHYGKDEKVNMYKAYTCFEKAAELGHKEAQYISYLRYSSLGKKRYFKKGINYLIESASQGYARAQGSLRWYYFSKGETEKSDSVDIVLKNNPISSKEYIYSDDDFLIYTENFIDVLSKFWNEKYNPQIGMKNEEFLDFVHEYNNSY